ALAQLRQGSAAALGQNLKKQSFEKKAHARADAGLYGLGEGNKDWKRGNHPMKNRSATLAAPHVRQFLQTQRCSAATDAELLERFLARHEEAAFAELVQRHGPIVLGLCRRVLRNQHDAEDAFQATFFVLARKGGSIRRPESLAGWLLHVA